MKRALALGLSFLLLAGCVSQQEYDAAKKQRDEAIAQKQALEQSIPELKRESEEIAGVKAQLQKDRETLNTFIQQATAQLTGARSFVLQFFGEVVSSASGYIVRIDAAESDVDRQQAQISAALQRAESTLALSESRIRQASATIDRIETERTNLFNQALSIAQPLAAAVPGGGVAVGLLGTLAGAGGLGMFGIKASESNKRKKIIETTERFGLIPDSPEVDKLKDKARLALGERGYAELQKIVGNITKKA